MAIEKQMRLALPPDAMRIFATEGWEIFRSPRDSKIYIYPSSYHPPALAFTYQYLAELLLTSVPNCPSDLKDALSSYLHRSGCAPAPTSIPYVGLGLDL